MISSYTVLNFFANFQPHYSCKMILIKKSVYVATPTKHQNPTKHFLWISPWHGMERYPIPIIRILASNKFHSLSKY